MNLAHTHPSAPAPAWSSPASEESLARAEKALSSNGFHVVVARSREAARAAVHAWLPPGSEVLDCTSRTLEDLGLVNELRDPARYRNVRAAYEHVPDMAARAEARRKASTPEYVIGSVHAVTEDGSVLIASAGGSQLAPYVYGARRVLWVVGTQKIVPDLERGMQRIRDYTFPLEEARMRAVTGGKFGSAINNVLVMNHTMHERVSIVFVTESLGF